MSLPTDLLAFFEEHRGCGDLDGGVERGTVWMACDCGAVLARPIGDESTHGLTRGDFRFGGE